MHFCHSFFGKNTLSMKKNSCYHSVHEEGLAGIEKILSCVTFGNDILLFERLLEKLKSARDLLKIRTREGC